MNPCHHNTRGICLPCEATKKARNRQAPALLPLHLRVRLDRDLTYCGLQGVVPWSTLGSHDEERFCRICLNNLNRAVNKERRVALKAWRSRPFAEKAAALHHTLIQDHYFGSALYYILIVALLPFVALIAVTSWQHGGPGWAIFNPTLFLFTVWSALVRRS